MIETFVVRLDLIESSTVNSDIGLSGAFSYLSSSII